jgi:hypothetical protein
LTLTLVLASAPSEAKLDISIGKKCEKAGATYSKAEDKLICTKLNSGLFWQLDSTSSLIKMWKLISEIDAAKNQSENFITPIYSPKVKRILANSILSFIVKASRFWQDQVADNIVMPVFFFTENDVNWYKDELLNLGLTKDEVDRKILQVQDEIRRNGSRSNMAGMNRYHGINWMEFMIGSKKSLVDLHEMMVGPHEWTHFAQYEVIGSENLEYAPCWFMEGSAEFYGMMLGALNQKTIFSMRKRQLSEKYPKNFLGMRYEVSQGWENFLEENGPPVTNPSYDSDCGINGTYTVGAAATEYLFLMKGQQGIVDFMSQIGTRKDFKSSFRSVYGIDWSVGKKQIANYIRTITAQNRIN